MKAERTVHRATCNPSKANPGETLYVTVPPLDHKFVLFPGSLALRFDLILSGEANNFVVDNVVRALVNRLTIKIGGEVLQDSNRIDLFQLYSDLFFQSMREKIELIKVFNQQISSYCAAKQEMPVQAT